MLRCAVIDDFESNRATSPIFARVQIAGAVGDRVLWGGLIRQRDERSTQRSTHSSLPITLSWHTTV